MAVKQIENLLALLEFFAERRRPATLADVVRHFDWPRSSAFNILSTLTAAGYLYEPRARGGYYPTPRWAQIVTAFSGAEPLLEPLRAIITGLAESTGETVWVSAPSGLFAVFLEVIESGAPIRYAAQPGKRVPIHLTASGQALLSRMPPGDRDVILRKVGFDSCGPNAPRSVEEVNQQIAAGQARGWFVSASAYSPDLGGVAIPVEINDRVFAITVAGPLFRVGEKAEEHARAIRDAIVRELGPEYAPQTP